jgi:rare lipoprotein A (peptidoglycan hydrolase)
MNPPRQTTDTCRARCAALTALCAIVAALCALTGGGFATPAAATTGGAATTVASDAHVGRDLAFTALRSGAATWYGPGLYGRRTACGQTLRPGTLGVAHRRLPCGTPVKIVYGGRAIVTRVIDRGPFSRGYSWDLTNGVREALGFDGSGTIRYAVALSLARP